MRRSGDFATHEEESFEDDAGTILSEKLCLLMSREVGGRHPILPL